MSAKEGHKTVDDDKGHPPVFQESDLLNMSPFKWDKTVSLSEHERVSKAGAPYKVTRMAIRPIFLPENGRSFIVEVFQRTARTIRVLSEYQDAVIVATEGPRGQNGFTNVLLSLRKEGRLH